MTPFINLLAFKRSFLIECIKAKSMRKKSLIHFEICQDLKNGMKQEEIAEKFDMQSRNIRLIKRQYCPNCGLLPGYRILKTNR